MWLKMLVVLALSLASVPVFAQGPPRLTPLVVGGDQFFRLQWASTDGNGRAGVWGSIFNDYGFAARDVRLLIDSLDATGTVTAQTIAYLPFALTPGTQAYFEARIPARADRYHVQMYSWEWIQAGSGGDPR